MLPVPVLLNTSDFVLSLCRTTSLYLQNRQEIKGWIKTIGMIGIFSGTDMIKIWNWFTAIGSFVRKIQEKNTSAELSWCRNVSHRYRIVRVPNCLGAEMSRTGAEVSWCRIVPVPKYLAFTKKSNLPSLSLIILCQKTGMDRNYCLIVFIVYMSYSDT